MISIAICDDEISALENLKTCLNHYPGAVLEVDAFSCGEDLLLSDTSYQIIILDIDMKGINGIETARQLRLKDKKVQIIYLTNYSDYTIFAFAVHAFAYLLKPVHKEDLYKQLREALAYQADRLKNVDTEHEFLTSEGIVRTPLKNILYFEYQNRYVKMMLLNPEGGTSIYRLKKRITDVAQELSDCNFAVPHKSFVVNLYQVKAIKAYDIYMTDGSLLPLSQKKSAEFRRYLNHYLADRL